MRENSLATRQTDTVPVRRRCALFQMQLRMRHMKWKRIGGKKKYIYEKKQEASWIGMRKKKKVFYYRFGSHPKNV